MRSILLAAFALLLVGCSKSDDAVIDYLAFGSLEKVEEGLKGSWTDGFAHICFTGDTTIAKRGSTVYSPPKVGKFFDAGFDGNGTFVSATKKDGKFIIKYVEGLFNADQIDGKPYRYILIDSLTSRVLIVKFMHSEKDADLYPRNRYVKPSGIDNSCF